MTSQRSVLCPSVLAGCTDGLVGVAARVALVQVPWLTLEAVPSPDLTQHIAGLEAMLREMQLKASQDFLLEHLDHMCCTLLNRSCCCRFLWRSGP